MITKEMVVFYVINALEENGVDVDNMQCGVLSEICNSVAKFTDEWCKKGIDNNVTKTVKEINCQGLVINKETAKMFGYDRSEPKVMALGFEKHNDGTFSEPIFAKEFLGKMDKQIVEGCFAVCSRVDGKVNRMLKLVSRALEEGIKVYEFWCPSIFRTKEEAYAALQNSDEPNEHAIYKINLILEKIEEI